MKCLKCGGDSIKYGSQLSKAIGKYQQTYKCKECGYHFTKQTQSRSSEEKKQAAIDRYRAGYSPSQIAADLGVHKRTIYRWFHEIYL